MVILFSSLMQDLGVEILLIKRTIMEVFGLETWAYQSIPMDTWIWIFVQMAHSN